MDDGRLRAIETIYNGLRFRSRLEARWAVFMDALGVKYQYEVQGYDLDGLWYLPDFWLPGLRAWLEVKGPPMLDFDETWEKARRLAEEADLRVYVFDKPITTPNNTSGHRFTGLETSDYIEKYGAGFRPDWVFWYQCPLCRQFQPGQHAYELPCDCFLAMEEPGQNAAIQQACERARQARFEHGERP